MVKGQKVDRITGATIVDPVSGKLITGRDIFISDRKISGVCEPAPAGTPALDASRLYAIPGLIDTHVHSLGIFVDGMPGPADLGWVKEQQRKNYRAFIRSGVTTLRDLGGPMKMIRAAAEDAKKNVTESPRILYSGSLLCVEKGYPFFVNNGMFPLNLITGDVRIDVTGRISARNAVDKLAGNGVSCIKVAYQSMKYDDRRTRIKFFPNAWLKAIVDRAHDHGLPVAIHQVYREDLMRIIDIPFDSFEHVTCDYVLTDEEVQRVVSNGACVSATLMTFGIANLTKRYEELLETRSGELFEKKPLRAVREAVEALRSGEAVTEYFGPQIIFEAWRTLRENVGRLASAGVKIINGTDSCGAITPAGCPVWEFSEMKASGMSELEILRAATTNAARAIGRADLGRIEEGCTADVVLLRKNPLEDIEAVADVAGVIREGRVARFN